MQDLKEEVKEVVQNEQDAPVINQDLVDRLKKEVESFQEELKNKVYPVKVETEELLGQMIGFIEEEAEWKNMECLGILELSKTLNEQKGKIKGGNIYMKALELDAMMFFLSNVKSRTLHNAKLHISKIKPIDAALKLKESDIIKLNNLLTELDAAENGIEIAKTTKDAE